MSGNIRFKALVVVVAMQIFSVASVAYAAPMTKAEHEGHKAQISETYKADRAACASMAGNAKDVCLEEGKAKEKIALAELEYTFTGKPGDRYKLAVAKAEGAYSVAKEKCDDKSGNAKDVCIKEAKAVEAKALADAKMSEEIGEAKKDAAAEKSEADYKVQVEKCDALAGDAKTNCIAAAKKKFGKL